MKKRFTKKDLENITDINFAINILNKEISKCWVLLSYKRIKLEKTILTLQEIKNKCMKIKPELIKASWL